MSKNEEIIAELRAISARVNDGSVDSVLAGQSQGLSLAAAILEKKGAALDGEWQSERPEAGEWWVSARPEVRKYWLPHRGRVRVPVTVDALGVMNKGRRWDKDAAVFTGALWQRRTVPGDPFKGGA
jgi:hypothetical protein